MRKFIAIIASLAVGLLMTAAGLVFDARELAIAGIILFGLAAVLWLVKWGKGSSDQQGKLTKDELLLRSAEAARQTALNALRYDDPEFLARAVPVVHSAILAAANRYGLARPAMPVDPREAVRRGSDYLSLVLPYLKLDQREAATRTALGFVRQHGREILHR